MAGLFGILREGKAVRTIAAGAAVACVAATALGVEVERLAQSGGSTMIATLFSGPRPSLGLHANAIDFATTGSIQADGRHELVVLGPCGDPERSSLTPEGRQSLSGILASRPPVDRQPLFERAEAPLERRRVGVLSSR